MNSKGHPSRPKRRNGFQGTFWLVYLSISLALIVNQSLIVLTHEKRALEAPSVDELEAVGAEMEGNKPVQLLMAKTISIKDVNDTLADIVALRRQLDPQKYQLRWRLFCYNQVTNDYLMGLYSDKEWKEKLRAEVHYVQGSAKATFWYKYMDPKTIPNEIDYVWIHDGDIRLRNMAWDCFWNTVSIFQPLIFAPTIMSSLSEKSEERKMYTGSTHPGHCYREPEFSWRQHIFRKTAAMDVSNVEIQTPIFKAVAWRTVHTVLTERIPEWGTYTSSWGPDLFWCGIVDRKLYGVNSTERYWHRPRYRWTEAKKICDFPRYLRFQEKDWGTTYFDRFDKNTYPHACMIIHSTPVEHLDSKTLPMYNVTKREIAREIANRTRSRYFSALSDYVNHAQKPHLHLYRAYIAANATAETCQPCKYEGCNVTR